MRSDVEEFNLTLGTYFLLLFAALVVLALIVELVTFCRDAMRTSSSAAADEGWPEPDRRVLFRLALVGGATALAVAAAIIAGYSLDPRQTGRQRQPDAGNNQKNRWRCLELPRDDSHDHKNREQQQDGRDDIDRDLGQRQIGRRELHKGNRDDQPDDARQHE